MKPTEHKQEILDKRYMRMALIWAENSYCQRRQVGALNCQRQDDYFGWLQRYSRRL